MRNLLHTMLEWLNRRFPATQWFNDWLTGYYAPRNLNFWYYFGSLALLVFVIQIISGIFLTMHYKPSVEHAFASVEYIMRDVPYGWLIRYVHSTGASMFFLVVYLHMFRGMLYGSYKKPRELLWVFGMVIFLVLMAEAFMGYLLPWGQMSFWGAQVITSLFSAVPFAGDEIVELLRGDYVVSDATLNRFFALHVIAIPLGLVMLVFFHLISLRQVGSNNPDGIEIKSNLGADGKPVDGIPFHPYYTVKDLFGTGVFLTIFFAIIFFAPEMNGLFLEHDNFVTANPLVTPVDIKPVWYFTPFYAILRAVPDKFIGVVLMGASVMVLVVLPWLDRSVNKSIRYRGIPYRVALSVFVVSFIALGYLGMQKATELVTTQSQIFTFFYFGYFAFLFVYTTWYEKEVKIPDRVTD